MKWTNSNNNTLLYVVGAEYNSIQFHTEDDWFINFSSFGIHWQNHPSYLVSQFIIILGGLLTAIDAINRGGRYPCLWLGTVIHGYVMEYSMFAESSKNFWHSQTPVMLHGRRLPIHALFTYPCFIYNSALAVSKLKLPVWAEALATGLCSILFSVPFDVISTKYVHRTWFNIYRTGGRSYWTPLNSYYIQGAYTAMFMFVMQAWRMTILGDEESGEPWFLFLDTILLLLPSLCSMFISSLIISSQTKMYFVLQPQILLGLFAISLILVGLGKPKIDLKKIKLKIKQHWSSWILTTHTALHFIGYFLIALVFDPENEIMIGLRKPLILSCRHAVKRGRGVKAAIDEIFMCGTDYYKYYDWHCLAKMPSEKAHWFTVCGMPFANHMLWISVLFSAGAAGCVLFGYLHLKEDENEAE